MKYKLNILWNDEDVVSDMYPITHWHEWYSDALKDIGYWLGYLIAGSVVGVPSGGRRIEVRMERDSNVPMPKIAPEKMAEIKEHEVMTRVLLHYEEDRLVAIERVK